MHHEKPYFELEQLLPNQDWTYDYEDVWELAEDRVSGLTDEQCRRLLRDIDLMFRLCADSAARKARYCLNGAFLEQGDDFDIWLLAVRRRTEHALAGIHSEPVQAPPGSCGR